MTTPPRASTRISTALAVLSDRNTAGRDVTVGDALSGTGIHGHGLAILVLSLPEMVPVPVPWLSTILGVPLLAVSGHLALFGDGVRLPKSLLGRVLPSKVVAGLNRYGLPPIRLVERWSRPRLPAIADRDRLIGLLCAIVSLVLFLPIPFLNGIPAAILILLSWGLIQRDGAFVLVGAAATVAMIAGSVFLGSLLLDALRNLGGLILSPQR